MRPGVEPGDAARQLLDMEQPALEIAAVHVGDLEFAPRRRLQPRRDLDDAVIVEVEAGDRIRRLRPRRLFLEADGPAARVELHHAIPFRIADLIPEHRGADLPRHGITEIIGEMSPVENVVAQRQRHPIVADELAADQKRLRQAVRAWLCCVLDAQADVPAVAEQPQEPVLLVRRGDDQDAADARQHQRR